MEELLEWMLSSEVLQQLYSKWWELLNRNEGKHLEKSFISMEKPCVPMGIKSKAYCIGME